MKKNQISVLHQFFIVGLLSILLVGNVFAAGLGNLQVFNALGQPLRAEINISVSSDELQTLKARVASPEVFKKKGLDYRSFMRDMKLTVVSKEGKYFLELTTDSVVNEPVVSIIINLNWATGEASKTYNFLLDPVGLNVSNTPENVVTAKASNVERPVTRTTKVANNFKKASAHNAASVESSNIRTSYRVKQGDTLSQVARQHIVNKAQLNQMMLAMLSANPEAFSDNNINRLKKGSVLRVPSHQEVSKISAEQANHEIKIQIRDFQAYRQKLASIAGKSTATPSANNQKNSQQSSGKVQASVTEYAKANESNGFLKVSSGKADNENNFAEKKQALVEDLSAKKQELIELKERIADLEKNSQDVQQLLKLKNEQIKQLSLEKEQLQAKTKKYSGFMSFLMDNLLSFIAVIFLIILMIIWFSYKRKVPRDKMGITKQDSVANSVTESMLSASIQQTHENDIISLAESKQHNDTAQDFSMVSAEKTIDGKQELEIVGIDSITMANMHLSNQNYLDSEATLLEATKTSADPATAYLKLLKIYKQNHDAKKFNQILEQLAQLTSEKGDVWEQAQLLSKSMHQIHSVSLESKEQEDLSLDISPSSMPVNSLFDTLAISKMGLPSLDLGIAETEKNDAPKQNEPLPELSLPLDNGLSFGQNMDQHENEKISISDLRFSSEHVVSSQALTEELDIEMDNSFTVDSSALIDLDSGKDKGVSFNTLPLETAPLVEGRNKTNDPYETKLQLAKALSSTGNIEGAKSLYQEVIAAGNADQIASAEVMLKKIEDGNI